MMTTSRPPRTHLIEKAPTGEPMVQIDERMQLKVELRQLEARVTRLEDYLASRMTWTIRWYRLRVWAARHCTALWTRLRGLRA